MENLSECEAVFQTLDAKLRPIAERPIDLTRLGEKAC